MSLFLAAAAGFISGKAKKAQEKREEERVMREEERQFERQRKLYELQYDMQSRSERAKRVEEMTQQVVTLLRISGGQLSEEAAVNIVSSGMFDDIRDAAAKGELNYNRAEAVFGGGADVTEVDVDGLMAPEGSGLYMTRQEEGGGPTDFNSFAKSMQGTISSLFPEGVITFRTTPTGDTIPFFNTQNAQGVNISTMYDNLLTRSFELYDTLYPTMGQRAALVTVKDYLLKSPFDINNQAAFDAVVDGLVKATQSRRAPVLVTPPAPVPTPRPVTPPTTGDEPTGPAGIIPSVTPAVRLRTGLSGFRVNPEEDEEDTFGDSWNYNINYGR